MSRFSRTCSRSSSSSRREADRDGVRQVQVRGDAQRAEAGSDRPRDHPVRYSTARHRTGKRLPVHRAEPWHRVRQVGHAGSGQDDVHVHAPRRVLRRRRGVRTGEHHRGRRAWSPGSDLDPQLLPGRAGHRAATDNPDPHEHEDGAAPVGVQQQLRPCRAAEDDPRRDADPLPEHDHGSGDGVHRRTDGGRMRKVPELRRADALHRLALHRVRRVRRHLPD